MKISIVGMGVVSALGKGAAETMRTLENAESRIAPMTLFPVSAPRLPVGMCPIVTEDDPLPRTHCLARLAADPCMDNAENPPDAIVVGTTTGGMLTTENRLRAKMWDPAGYAYHAAGSVAEYLARRYACTGPVLTVTTACASGAAAIAIARDMLQAGLGKRILAGGADSLCRLTYYGFFSLQLIDPRGARPLSLDRKGMSVAEGAGMVLLESRDDPTPFPAILGAGFSCDAHHPTAPHPEGRGALSAMGSALIDAGVLPADIDYINLHGTGTPDNDLSEARAVRALFGDRPPPLSSIKGVMGHPLAAAGAVEAVVSAGCIKNGLLPANSGFYKYDSHVGLLPIRQTEHRAVATVLSNSFGFGGNNTALVFGNSEKRHEDARRLPAAMTVLSAACLTGAGRTGKCLALMDRDRDCAGILDMQTLVEGLPAKSVRRMKRLSRMALSLATETRAETAADVQPNAVFLGTAWGALSETHDFLERLYDTDEKFPSPIDFIGSVHNAAAGHIAQAFNATGANITTTGGDGSFEQALLISDLLTRRHTAPFWVIGVDAYHSTLSPLLNPMPPFIAPADGGGALLMVREKQPAGPVIRLRHFARHADVARDVSVLCDRLSGRRDLAGRCDLWLVGIPASHRPLAEKQLDLLRRKTGSAVPVIDYRKLTGEFAAASAVATVWAVKRLTRPPTAGVGFDRPAVHGRILVLGLGPHLSAVEVFLP